MLVWNIDVDPLFFTTQLATQSEIYEFYGTLGQYYDIFGLEVDLDYTLSMNIYHNFNQFS